jgi:hypothetical protein
VQKRNLGPIGLFGRAGTLRDSPVVQRTLRLIEAVKQAGGLKALGATENDNRLALEKLDRNLDKPAKQNAAEMAYGSYVTFCKSLGQQPMSRDEYEIARKGA